MKLARFVLAALTLTTLAACSGDPITPDVRDKIRPSANEVVHPDSIGIADADPADAGADFDETVQCVGEIVTVTAADGTVTTLCRNSQIGSGG